MGKLFRKIWIGLLSGTAVLASCNFQSTEQPCLYGPAPVDDSIVDTVQPDRRQVVMERLDAVRDIIEERQNSEIYGPPEMMEEYSKETMRYMAEADSLERELKALDEH